jgi:hypothetical protein
VGRPRGTATNGSFVVSVFRVIMIYVLGCAWCDDVGGAISDYSEYKGLLQSRDDCVGLLLFRFASDLFWGYLIYPFYVPVRRLLEFGSNTPRDGIGKFRRF